MSDESQLQIRPKDCDSSLILSRARSSLIERGRKDAGLLVTEQNEGPVPLLKSRVLRLAEQGDPEAQWDVGSFYLWDLGDSFWADSTQEAITTDGPPDYAEAANWLRKAAEQGHASSQRDLGSMYFKGEGTARDYAEAARWYVRAAEQGDSEAQFRIGELYTHGQGVEQDHIMAAEWYMEAAKQGHGLAQFNIGVMYQNGDGVEQDYSLAARWYRLAAECRGEDPPTFDPEVICREGEGEDASDSTEASEWYLRVLYGVSAAQFNLGVLYEAGAGVSKDYFLAHLWMKLAADRAGAVGRYAAGRDRVLAEMTGTEAAEAERLADSLRKLAEKREQNVADAVTALKRRLEARRSDIQSDSQRE